MPIKKKWTTNHSLLLRPSSIKGTKLYGHIQTVHWEWCLVSACLCSLFRQHLEKCLLTRVKPLPGSMLTVKRPNMALFVCLTYSPHFPPGKTGLLLCFRQLVQPKNRGETTRGWFLPSSHCSSRPVKEGRAGGLQPETFDLKAKCWAQQKLPARR